MIILCLKLVDGTLNLSLSPYLSITSTTNLTTITNCSPLGDLNKALKDLVTVITDQEIEQSDLNENEIE